MLSLSQAWGTQFQPIEVEPEALATLTFAAAMNLTGARSLVEAAAQSNNFTLQRAARPFAEAAQFIQRNYNKHPDYVITVLGQCGRATHVVVADAEGTIVFDTYEGSRLSYFPGYMFTYCLGQAGVEEVAVQAKRTLHDAYVELQEQGLWKDNAWSWDVDSPRGSNYL